MNHQNKEKKRAEARATLLKARETGLKCLMETILTGNVFVRRAALEFPMSEPQIELLDQLKKLLVKYPLPPGVPFWEHVVIVVETERFVTEIDNIIEEGYRDFLNNLRGY